MTAMPLRPHQVEAVDGALRMLANPPGGAIPEKGLRAQVIAATGSGKTRVGVEVANRLSARRVRPLKHRQRGVRRDRRHGLQVPHPLRQITRIGG
ncbi:DEAD/DEAH box helicase family protein, partial [Streptomyces sp. sk2.1]|uniref:DEAD/DEAH box helicase family protein n=1 Tax=Streptomyces sp. sk2.1 TaxID=2478959 RepID=UPI0011E6AE60